MTAVPTPLLVALGALSEVRRLPAHAVSAGLVVLEGTARARRGYQDLAARGAEVLGGLLGGDERVPVPRPVTPDEPAPTRVGDEPFPGYDELSLGTLRNALRGLPRGEVERARDYERANLARGPVLTLLENRLARLAAE